MRASVLPIRNFRQNVSACDGMAPPGIPGAIARSPQMERVFEYVTRVAPHFRTVLVTGETGTGKEIISRALHDLSPAGGRFVTLNCSAVVETLFESELFGHVRGAFTGADRDKIGQCEYADGGTLLLDEIGDMPLSTQAKLLRMLQNQEVQRVGSLAPRKVDVRVVAATNKDLKAAVSQKTFREDLYYRLSMIEIHLPALRDRDGDIPVLTDHFVRQWALRYHKNVTRISAAAMEILAAHMWPGNVRELENVLGYACMMTSGETLEVEDLPGYLLSVPVNSLLPALTAMEATADAEPAAGLLEKCESWLLQHALDRANWNQSKAARALGTTRDRLRYRIKKYQLGKGSFEGQEAEHG
jgi:two-component system, NtrC family, response regulator HydG